MNIGIRLRELRLAKGFSQGDIEKRTGLLRCYTSRVENGFTIPSLQTLERFAGALEVELSQLFSEGEGKAKGVFQKMPATLSSETRGLVDSFTCLDSRDRKLVVAMVRKMAKESRAAKRSS